MAIYESISNQAAHFLQSLDRVHRRGQERDVDYVALLSTNSIEGLEYQRLHQKAQAQADLLGDDHDEPMTRVLMLQDLVVAAVNEGMRASQQLQAEKMGSVTGDIDLGGLSGLLG